MSDQIIGRRVVAWTGPQDGQHGRVVRVDGIHRVLVRWDGPQGWEDWYRAANLLREEDATKREP